MTSGTFFNKGVVFKSALKRLKWLGILYAVALFLELPLLIWMELGKQKMQLGNQWAELANNNFSPQMLFHPVANLTNIVVSLVFGLILFYYLQNDRAGTFFHNLPIKRWSLYCQNLLAGLTLIWLPILINGLLIYGVLSYYGVNEVQWTNTNLHGPYGEPINAGQPGIPVGQLLAHWLLLSLFMTALFYIFTVFVGMLTGNVLLQGALTLIGLVLPLGLYILVKYNLWKLLYGFPRDLNERATLWLSPLVKYLDIQDYRLLFKSPAGHLWYLAAAVFFCLAGLYLYRQRHVEAAGETLAAGWIRHLFKYGVAACAALTGGVYFSTFSDNSPAAMYLGYIIGGALGYIIADMIAYKSFQFYKRWKGLLVFGAVFVLLLASVKLDLYGYQKYVPAQDEVKEVYLSGLNRDNMPAAEGYNSEESISRVRQLHRQIIKLEKENRAKATTFYRPVPGGPVRPGDPISMPMSTDITYFLDSGSKVKRTYIIDLNSYREFLQPVFNLPEVKRSMYGRLFSTAENKIDQININNYRMNKSVRIYKPEEVKEALAALKKDVLQVSYAAVIEGKEPNLANLELVTKSGFEQKYGYYNLNYYQEFKNFTAFLAAHGYPEELFLNPQEVAKIIVKKVGSNETVEIKDKQEILALLNWSSREDEQAHKNRQQLVNKGMVEYYGKVVMTKGNPMFVMFESSPYAQQLIEKLLQE